MFLALVFLSIMQTSFLFIVGPLLKTLFLINYSTNTVCFQELLPHALIKYNIVWLQSICVSRNYLIVFLPLLIILIAIGRSLANYYYHLNQFFFSLFVAKNYRDMLFKSIIIQPYDVLVTRTPAEWTSMVTNDVYFLQNKFADIVTSFIKDPVLIFACFVVLWFLNWPSAVILALIGIPLAIFMSHIAQKISYYANFWQVELAKVLERFLNIRLRFNFIRSQGGENIESIRFKNVNNNFYKSVRRSIFFRAIFAPSLEFIGVVIFALFFILISRGYITDIFSADKMIELLVALGLILKPLRELGEQIVRFKETKGTLSRSLQIVQKFLDKKQREVLTKKIINTPDISIKKNISLLLSEGLHYSSLQCGYDSKICMQAENIIFYMGKTYAIIGPSGSGKSTFLKTLAGLIPPIKSQELHGLLWQQVADNTCFVSQEPFLFEDTLRSNLLYGMSEDNNITDDMIWEYIKLLNIFSETKSLNLGLNTIIKSVNTNLSGGQVQRFVVVRELLRNKRILLFDEMSSAIDFKTEKDIVEKIIDYVKCNHKLLILVTHRLQLLNMFDEILFIENGKLLFRGPHNELMLKDRYRSFYESGKIII